MHSHWIEDINQVELRARRIASLSSGLQNNPKYLQQTNDVTCVHTCLAMVTGLKVTDLIAVFGDHRGLDIRVQQEFLGLCGIRYREIGNHEVLKHGAYLGTIQSLNFKNTTHRVVILCRQGVITVLDPQRGRKGKKAFTRKLLYGGHPAFNLMRLEHGCFFVPGLEYTA